MWNSAKIGKRKCIFTFQQQTEKSFLFIVLEYFFLFFLRGTRISSSLILNILIGWAVEDCGDVMFCYFLLADNSGCYKIIIIIVIIIIGK